MAIVLIVDDHAVNREFLATLLGYRGDRIIQAENGIRALELARQEQPHLVITDILMPAMDGYEFVRHLRADTSIAHIPVIFCSAVYHASEARELAQSCGVAHVLGKPCEPELVLQAVEEVLEKHGSVAAATSLGEFDREHLRVVTNKLVNIASDFSQVNERLAELIEINLQLASVRNPRHLLENMCDSARRLIGANHAVIGICEKNKEKAVSFISSGIDVNVATSFKAPAGRQGMLGQIVGKRHSRRGLLMREKAAKQLGLPQPYPAFESFLAAPIVSIAHTYGWICLTERINGAEFSEEDERLLSILAAQVGRIYENGSIYAELLEKEERFRQLADHINEVFFLINPDGTQMLYVNHGYEAIWGRSRESLYANSRSWLEAVHPDDTGIAFAGFELVEKQGGFDSTFRIIRTDGSVRWIRARGFPIRNPAGELYRVAGLAEDVTSSREAEAKIQRLNRVYAVLSGINTTIVRIRDRQGLFNEACRIAVEDGRFRMCWIGICEADGKIAPLASAGHNDDYFRFLEAQMRDSAVNAGLSSSQAVRNIHAVIHNNLDTVLLPWAKEAQARGFRAEAAFPLVISGNAIGVINLYASEPDFFDTDEIKLLEELASDISFAIEFIENENRLNHVAYHDELTGLVNRNSVFRSLGDLLRTPTATPHPFAFILLNMNGFRDINNTLGHHNGDELLRQIGRRLLAAVWETDIVASLGSDDFAVLLPRLSDADQVRIVLDKILLSFQQSFSIANIPISVDAAMGIAMYPEHGDNAEVLWQRADIALRAAKETHKVYKFYDRDIDRFDPLQLALMGELRGAISKDELVLHYQPKIDLKTGRAVGVEALVRWQNPSRGLIFPDAFIPFAERTDLINPLTTWVLETAIRQVAAWRKQGFPLDLAVNLSVRNLQSPEMCSRIIKLVEAARLPFRCLTLEITESAIMDDPEHAKEVLTEMHTAGISLAVDDFGIGRASLHYLKELPINTLKIDKSFVMDFSNSRNAAIVRSTIELGHNLGFTVIAEGVEDGQTCLALRNLGCDRAQGFYFSRGLPAEEFIVWLGGYKAADF